MPAGSVAMKINFDHVEGFRNNRVRRKSIFHGVWTELRIELCFLKQSFTKYSETNLGNRQVGI